MSNKLNLKIKQGSTLSKSLRWETAPLIYKPIASASQSAPLALNIPSHGLLDDQYFGIQSIKGMTELNTKGYPYRATVVDSDNVVVNDLNSLDYKTHTASTGVIVYRTVRDLTGYTARMSVRDKVGGTLLYDMTIGSGLSIDTSSRRLTIVFPADDTATFTWSFGVYDLELESPSGEVTTILQGSVSVQKEVTV